MCSGQDRATDYIYKKKKNWRDLAYSSCCNQSLNILKRSISRGSSHRDHLIVVGVAKRPDEINLIIASVSCGWRSSLEKIGTNCLKLYSKDNILRPFKFNYHISTVKFPAPLPKGAQNGLLDISDVKATVALKDLKYLYVNFALLTVVPMKTEIFNQYSLVLVYQYILKIKLYLKFGFWPLPSGWVRVVEYYKWLNILCLVNLLDKLNWIFEDVLHFCYYWWSVKS